MQLKYLKFCLVSALIGGSIWFLLTQIGIYTMPRIIVRLGLLGILLLSIIGIDLGSYIGLWSLGKIRKPSFTYGIMIGLFSYLLYIGLFFLVGVVVIAKTQTGTYGVNMAGWFPIDLIFALVAGIIGVAIIRRMAPSFCPNCGNKLPHGNEPCSNCGARVE